ncbi:MAG: ectoine hydroxylase [Zoogloeaceae bacterium]|nr:ectoine hydroxylase [Zoogloeaceae bacterium]
MTPITQPYQSRLAQEAAMVLRQEPVVYPHARLPPGRGLDPAQLKRYEEDGFVQIEDFFGPEEIADFRAELQRMASDATLTAREETIREPGGRDVRSIFSIHTLSDAFSRLARHPRLLDITQQILGSRVYIHQSRANLKPGFSGKEFYWHSDFETWHVEDGMPAMRAVSCSIALTDNNEFNGPLMLMPGSHRQFIRCVGETPANHYKESLRAQHYGTPDPLHLSLLAEQGGIASIKGRAGSVVFFDCNTMHGSNSNISPFPRSNLFLVYNSVENTLNAPHGNLAPRPEFIATRENVRALTPVEPPVHRTPQAALTE